VDFLRTEPVDAVATLVADLCRNADIDPTKLAHIQLGVPGAYDPRTDTIHHVDVPGWSRPGLVSDLRERLGTQVEVENDVNLAAIAERRRGVARQTDAFALLWLGEGLGLAIDLGGTMLRGARGGAGEIGYMPLFVPGTRAERRRSKTDLQDLVGGPAVLALAGEHGSTGRTPVEAVATAASAADGEGPAADAAQTFLGELADRIAVGLAAVVAVLDPPLVVLAGEVAQAGGEPLCRAVTEAMRHAAPLETAVAVTAIEDDAVLLGGLDAGLTAVREALIASVHQPGTA
jgi:predicted NBD/HSP70 family sugar kinase